MEMLTDTKNCQFRNCAFQGSFAQKNLLWDKLSRSIICSEGSLLGAIK